MEKIYTLLKVDFSHNIYTQDFNGVSLINVLKCYPPIMPQDGSTPTEKVIMHTFESAQIVKLISQMASYYQHAAVSVSFSSKLHLDHLKFTTCT